MCYFSHDDVTNDDCVGGGICPDDEGFDDEGLDDDVSPDVEGFEDDVEEDDNDDDGLDNEDEGGVGLVTTKLNSNFLLFFVGCRTSTLAGATKISPFGPFSSLTLLPLPLPLPLSFDALADKSNDDETWESTGPPDAFTEPERES